MPTQKELHSFVISTLTESRDCIAALARPLDGATLHERPDSKGWSVAEVLEHLCVSDAVYADSLHSVLRAARVDAGAPARVWKPTILGNFLAKVLANPRKLKAPKAFQPGPAPRSGVVEACLALESAAIRTFDDAASLDWAAVRIANPALPRWLPKFNLGDVFRIRAIHVERHAQQIERIVKQLQ